MLSKSYTGQESDTLVDGASEILERERINEGVACCRGVRFRTALTG